MHNHVTVSDEKAPPLSSAEASLRCHEAEEKKKKARRAWWGGEREKGGFCQITCGSLAGFAVLWFWLNQSTILNNCEDNSIHVKRLVYANWWSLDFVSRIFYDSCFWSDCPLFFLIIKSSVINCSCPPWPYKGRRLRLGPIPVNCTYLKTVLACICKKAFLWFRFPSVEPSNEER